MIRKCYKVITDGIMYFDNYDEALRIDREYKEYRKKTEDRGFDLSDYNKLVNVLIEIGIEKHNIILFDNILKINDSVSFKFDNKGNYIGFI